MDQKHLLWLAPEQPSREIELAINDEQYQLLYTDSIPDAIGYCLSYQPELVLIDAQQAQMNLVDLVKLVKRTHQGGQIITLVESNQGELASQSLNNGNDEMLQTHIKYIHQPVEALLYFCTPSISKPHVPDTTQAKCMQKAVMRKGEYVLY